MTELSPALGRFARYVPSDLANKSGKVFYSGEQAFTNPSPLYLLGLNPGGDPIAQNSETVAWDLTTCMPSRPANWSAYRDESWGGAPGTWGLQPRVLHLLDRLSLDPGETASSNLVFVRSAREASVAKAEMAAYADMCWEFHEAVINQLGVKAVVCFGSTAGAQVRMRLDAHKQWGQFVERNARGWTSRAHLGRGGVNVVTVTHPSIADWRNPAADVSDLVAEAIR